MMQTERYILFVAVKFTLKIMLIGRAHIAHQTLIHFLRHLPNRTSFISSRELDPSSSSVRPETRTHSELWCESGPVSFGVLPGCTAAPERFFSTSPSHLALPGEF